MKLNRDHIKAAVATTLALGALAGGATVGKNLLESNAAAPRAVDASFGAKQAAAHALGSTDAPFLGPYKYTKGKKYQCGPGVHLLAVAYKRVKVATSTPSCFGPGMQSSTGKYQTRIHYKPTGVYNLVTHTYLVKHGGYTKEAKAGLVYLQQQRVVAEHLVQIQHQRAEIKPIAIHIAKVGGSTLTYSQNSSTRAIFPAWPGIPPATDCSGMSTFILYQDGAGASVGYFGPGSPVGWTGTLRYQGRHISSTATKYLYPGDLIFYHNWGHVAVYIGGGLVVSHGQTGVYIESYKYSHVDEVRRYIA